MFSINHIVCVNGLGTVSHSYYLGKLFYQERKCFQSSSQMPALQAGLSKVSYAEHLLSFWESGISVLLGRECFHGQPPVKNLGH